MRYGKGQHGGPFTGKGYPLLVRVEKEEEEAIEKVDRDDPDAEAITSCSQLVSQAAEESRKLWCLAGPAIFTSLAQYSLGAVTQIFAGHLTTLELDAVSTENIVIAGLAFGIMLGMRSALETVCGHLFSSHARICADSFKR